MADPTTPGSALPPEQIESDQKPKKDPLKVQYDANRKKVDQWASALLTDPDSLSRDRSPQAADLKRFISSSNIESGSALYEDTKGMLWQPVPEYKGWPKDEPQRRALLADFSKAYVNRAAHRAKSQGAQGAIEVDGVVFPAPELINYAAALPHTAPSFRLVRQATDTDTEATAIAPRVGVPKPQEEADERYDFKSEVDRKLKETLAAIPVVAAGAAAGAGFAAASQLPGGQALASELVYKPLLRKGWELSGAGIVADAIGDLFSSDEETEKAEEQRGETKANIQASSARNTIDTEEAPSESWDADAFSTFISDKIDAHPDEVRAYISVEGFKEGEFRDYRTKFWENKILKQEGYPQKYPTLYHVDDAAERKELRDKIERYVDSDVRQVSSFVLGQGGVLIDADPMGYIDEVAAQLPTLAMIPVAAALPSVVLKQGYDSDIGVPVRQLKKGSTLDQFTGLFPGTWLGGLQKHLLDETLGVQAVESPSDKFFRQFFYGTDDTSLSLSEMEEQRSTPALVAKRLTGPVGEIVANSESASHAIRSLGLSDQWDLGGDYRKLAVHGANGLIESLERATATNGDEEAKKRLAKDLMARTPLYEVAGNQWEMAARAADFGDAGATIARRFGILLGFSTDIAMPDPISMGLIGMGTLTRAASQGYKNYFNVPKLIRAQADLVESGKATFKDAYYALLEKNMGAAEIVQMRVTARLNVPSQIMAGIRSIERNAATAAERLVIASERAGIYSPSPAIIGDLTVSTPQAKSIWIRARVDELMHPDGGAFSFEQAKARALEEVEEKISQAATQALRATKPGDVYKSVEPDFEFYYLRTEENGKPVFREWFTHNLKDNTFSFAADGVVDSPKFSTQPVQRLKTKVKQPVVGTEDFYLKFRGVGSVVDVTDAVKANDNLGGPVSRASDWMEKNNAVSWVDSVGNIYNPRNVPARAASAYGIPLMRYRTVSTWAVDIIKEEFEAGQKTIGQASRIAEDHAKAVAEDLELAFQAADQNVKYLQALLEKFGGESGRVQDTFEAASNQLKVFFKERKKIMRELGKAQKSAYKWAIHKQGKLQQFVDQKRQLDSARGHVAWIQQQILKAKDDTIKVHYRKKLNEANRKVSARTTAYNRAKTSYDKANTQFEEVTAKSNALMEEYIRSEAKIRGAAQSLYGIDDLLSASFMPALDKPTKKKLSDIVTALRKATRQSEIDKLYAEFNKELSDLILQSGKVEDYASVRLMRRAISAQLKTARAKLNSVTKHINKNNLDLERYGEQLDAERISRFLEKRFKAQRDVAQGKAIVEEFRAVADMVEAGERALKATPDIPEKVIDVLAGAVTSKPSNPTFFRSLLSSLSLRAPRSADDFYVIDPTKLKELLEDQWGKEALDYLFEPIGKEGALRGGEGAELLKGIFEQARLKVPESKLNRESVYAVQQLHTALHRAWQRTRPEAGAIAYAEAIRLAEKDVFNSLYSVSTPSKIWLSTIRKVRGFKDPMGSRLGETTDAYRNVLRAPEQLLARSSSELLQLWKKATREGNAAADDILGIMTTEKGEVTRSDIILDNIREAVFRYVDSNDAINLGQRAPTPLLGRPDLTSSTWLNTTNPLQTPWEEFAHKVLSDPRLHPEGGIEFHRVKYAEELEKLDNYILEFFEGKGPDLPSTDNRINEAVRRIVKNNPDAATAQQRIRQHLTDAHYNPATWGSSAEEIPENANLLTGLTRAFLPRGSKTAEARGVSPSEIRALENVVYELLSHPIHGSSAKAFHAAYTARLTTPGRFWATKGFGRPPKGLGAWASYPKSSVVEGASASYSLGSMAMLIANGVALNRAQKLLTKTVTGFLDAKDVSAASKILDTNSSEWFKLSDGDIERGLNAIINAAGRPFTQREVRTAVAAAGESTKKLVRLIKSGEDSSGRALYMFTDLEQEILSHLNKAIQELEAQGVAARGEGLNLGARTLSLWKRAIVTGLFYPRYPQYLNNAVGNVSQVWGELGVLQAARTSKQFIDGIPYWSDRLWKWRQQLAERLGTDNVLPDMTSSLFHPTNQRILSGEAFYYRTKTGIVHKSTDTLNAALDTGVLDDYAAAELGSQMMLQAERTKPHQRIWGAGRDWMDDISNAASFVEQRQRFALFADLVDQGYTYEAAAKKTRAALYDWKFSIGQAEAKSLVRMLPFWRFFKNMIGQQFRLAREPFVKPSKEMVKMALTGNTYYARVHQQYIFVNALPEFLDPELAFKKDGESEVEYANRRIAAAYEEGLIPQWMGSANMAFHRKTADDQAKLYRSIRGVDRPITDTYSKLGPWTTVEGAEILGIFFSGMTSALISQFGSEELKRNLNPNVMGEVGIKFIDSLSPVHKEAFKAVLGLQNPYAHRRMTGFEQHLYKNHPFAASAIGLTPETVKDAYETGDGSHKVRVAQNIPYFLWKVGASSVVSSPVLENAYFENPYSQDLKDIEKAALFFLQSDLGFKPHPVSGAYSMSPDPDDVGKAYGILQQFGRTPETDVERQAAFMASERAKELTVEGKRVEEGKKTFGTPTPQEQRQGYQELIEAIEKDKKR